MKERIKKKLSPKDLNRLKQDFDTVSIPFKNHPLVTLVLVLGSVYVVLYLSTYFINVSAQLVKACKGFRREWMK